MISFLGLALGGAAAGVVAGALAAAQSDDGDHVEGAVGVAVAARVEAVSFGLAGGSGDGGGAAQVGEGGLAVEAVDVLPGGSTGNSPSPTTPPSSPPSTSPDRRNDIAAG
jgi:hypothetical protein